MKLKLSFLAGMFACLLFAQTAPSYYASVNFNQTGNTLKANLASLITSTHTKTISYSELQTLMKSSDVDPDKPGNLLLIYGSTTSGTHQRSRPVGGTWNREHVYAKSKGTPNLGTSGPGADGHHLRPADNTLNSTRGSLLFDDGTGPTAYKTSRGGWYPGDEWKGDVARILMYMYVRYNTRCLPLNITMTPNTYSSDFPDILLKWNVEDPVSAFEVQRNNVVAQTQKNRNPFIDNPYLATVIWGGAPAQNMWPDTFTGGTAGDTEAPTSPANFAITATTSTSVSLSWSASTDNFAVGGYEIYKNGTLYTTVFTTSHTVTGLTPETMYSFHVVAKDSAGNRSTPTDTLQVTTAEGNGGGAGTSCGTEDFENMPAVSSSYADRFWTKNSINWTATNARTDSQVYIDSSRAICIRKGSLKSSTISGGIGSLSVKTYLPFSDGSGMYTLKINGIIKGQIPATKTATTVTINDINVSGDFTIELVDDTGTSRVSFDNLTWTCYSTMGIDQSSVNNTKLTVYPNPVKNQEFYLDGISAKETVRIYSVTGQLLQTVPNVGNREKVALKKLTKGVYFITTKTQSAKFIVD